MNYPSEEKLAKLRGAEERIKDAKRKRAEATQGRTLEAKALASLDEEVIKAEQDFEKIKREEE